MSLLCGSHAEIPIGKLLQIHNRSSTGITDPQDPVPIHFLYFFPCQRSAVAVFDCHSNIVNIPGDIW